MNDRELLEAAAEAAGLHFHGHRETKTITATWVSTTGSTDDWFSWNPLTDDGDALRLAVTIGLVVDCSRPSAGEPYKQHHIWRDDLCDNATLTRRAIVRAAAEIGKDMQ